MKKYLLILFTVIASIAKQSPLQAQTIGAPIMSGAGASGGGSGGASSGPWEINPAGNIAEKDTGNTVTIGTTTPLAPLTVWSATASYLARFRTVGGTTGGISVDHPTKPFYSLFDTSGNEFGRLYFDDDTLRIESPSGNPIKIGSNSLVVDSGTVWTMDNVGIGTVTPTEKLHVDGNIICDTLNYSVLNPPVSGTAIDLDQTYTNLNAGGNYLAAYNGRSSNAGFYSTHRIGFAYSNDGRYFYKDRTFTIAPGSGYDSGGTYQPSLVRLPNGMYYLYYTGLSGGVESIGLYTSPDGITWTRYGQVLALGTGWEATGVLLPHVLYDETEVDATKRFKMWYSGYLVSAYGMGYAYSADGKTWTKYASNPVVAAGGGGAWDEGSVLSGLPIKENGTYTVFYEGYNVGLTQSKIGIATFSNPESTYTKSASNPIISNRPTATAALTADLLIGSRTVTVANTALFEVNESVILDDGNSEPSLNQIEYITSATTMTLKNAVTLDYTTAESALVRSIYYAKVAPTSILKSDNGYALYGTAYGAGITLNSVGYELSVVFNSVALDTGWTIDYAKGIVIPTGSSTSFDYVTCENPAILYNTNPFVYNSAKKATWADESNVWTQNQMVSRTSNAVSSWASTTSALQVADVAAYSVGGTLPHIGFNTWWDGSAYKYYLTSGAANIVKAAYASDEGSLGYAFAGLGTAGNTATMTVRYVMTASGSMFIGSNAGSMTRGTSAAGVLYFGTSTAPGSSPADQFGMYGTDANGAGTWAPHFLVESGATIKLYRLSALTTALTSITASAPGTPDYAVQDLTVGGFGFVTADEGQTVLSVIKNLQARVDELEARMKSLGILPP